jgi:hypothetical protein
MLILIVPVAAVIAVLFILLGGIEGAGKLIFLVALAPMLLLDPITKGVDGPIAWVTFVVAEAAYVFLLLLVGRFIWHQFSRPGTPAL